MDTQTSSNRVERLTLPIAGLECGSGGAQSIERALTRLPGVKRAYVNPATEMLYVEIDPERCTRSDLVAAVERAGYRVETAHRPWS